MKSWWAKLRSLVGSDRLNVNVRFELLREAISGTMSEFYLARERATDRIVGLKILNLAKTLAFEARFKGIHKPTEGEIATSLASPYIAETFEHGLTTTGQQYLVMEFLKGPGLNSLLAVRSDQLDGQRIILLRQMARGLDAVHQAGYIHRDICPRNFICAPDAKSLKLIDFGLTVPATRNFMLPGNRTGTPNYMAPEIVRRRPTDHRVDLFALGVTAYHLCSFQLPWTGGGGTAQAAMLHDTQTPVDIRELVPGLNDELAATIAMCLSVDPGSRPASAEEVAQRLERIPDDAA